MQTILMVRMPAEEVQRRQSKGVVALSATGRLEHFRLRLQLLVLLTRFSCFLHLLLHLLLLLVDLLLILLQLGKFEKRCILPSK
jgi:hypothetical protein